MVCSMLRKQFRKVEVPTLVLLGDADPFIDTTLGGLTLAYCPQGRCILYPQGSHFLHHEHWAQVRPICIKVYSEFDG